jgi:alkyl sulfatase BDS1-like metallo-beta-lactamase superfamily hydrolase
MVLISSNHNNDAPKFSLFQKKALYYNKRNLIIVDDNKATMTTICLRLGLIAFLFAFELQAQNPIPDNPLRAGANQKQATRINESIYQAIGFGNAMMVVTGEGNVVIDTSIRAQADRNKKLLQAENSGPIKYIILTHGHGDHTGGVRLWKEAGTQVIAQKNHVEFMNYQARLNGFFARRNAAQFPGTVPEVGPWPGNYGAKIEPTVLFDDRYEFTLGGVKFELYHTPGETPDHLTVWVPKYRAAFIGDNYYTSFPNMYTLRGTQQRPALDYINSLNKVLSLKPEIVIPSHGAAIHGNAEITARLTRYRDAIQYVHDAVVAGMNAGKDVFTLMREIRLPSNLEVGEGYGRLTWSIRGIYEGYAGWFDGNPPSMYDAPPSSAFPDLVKLAGGPDKVVQLAMERVASGELVAALHLTDAALAADSGHRPALEVRLQALQKLREQSHNSNESGWLDNGIQKVKQRLQGGARDK